MSDVAGLLQVLLSLLALYAAGAYSCNEHLPLLPPCPSATHYSIEQCTILDQAINTTRLRAQCVKVEPRNVYESWQFWTAIVAVLVVISKYEFIGQTARKVCKCILVCCRSV